MFTGFVAIFIFPTVKDGIVYEYPNKSKPTRLFSRQEEKATVDLLSSRLDGSLLRPPFHISFFGEADRSISVPPSPFV